MPSASVADELAGATSLRRRRTDERGAEGVRRTGGFDACTDATRGPARRTVTRWLARLDLDRFTVAVNDVQWEQVAGRLQRRLPLAVDLTSIAYHGQPHRPLSAVWRGPAKDGRARFQMYAILYRSFSATVSTPSRCCRCHEDPLRAERCCSSSPSPAIEVCVSAGCSPTEASAPRGDAWPVAARCAVHHAVGRPGTARRCPASWPRPAPHDAPGRWPTGDPGRRRGRGGARWSAPPRDATGRLRLRACVRWRGWLGQDHRSAPSPAPWHRDEPLADERATG